MKRKYILLLVFLVFFPLLSRAKTYRDSIDVTHYNISIEVNFFAQAITGFTELSITSSYDLNSIKLDLWGLFVDSVFVDGKRVKYKYLTNAFEVLQKLNSGDTVTLKVFYHGKPGRDPLFGGFYFSQIDAYNYGIGMKSNPLSLGRAWFPANDDFKDKATFEFHIKTDSTLQAVCNGLPVDTLYEGSKTVWSWRLEEPIPPYLANVAVGDYNLRKWTYHGLERDIPVMVFIPKAFGDNGFELFNDLDSVLQIYEKLFGPYRWERVGYVVTSSQAGAMEHATNISLPASVLENSLAAKRLVYHELAHSWFGNMVTCSSYKDMWLNEGWAKYAEMLAIEYLYGEEAFKQVMLEHHLYVINFAHVDDKGYHRLSDVPYEHTYGNTVYDKGADVLHTLRFYIGSDAFFDAVRKYLNTYAWKNVTTEEFKSFLEKTTNTSLTSFFDFWLYAKGFPHFELYDWYIGKKKNGLYPVIATFHQRVVGGDKLWDNAKFDLTFVDKDLKMETKQAVIDSTWTVDTFYLQFKPAQLMVDKDFHVTAAREQEYKLIDSAGIYLFDYELFDLVVESISKPALFYVAINWIAPGSTNLPGGYLLQQNYYWTVKMAGDKKVKARGRFYLTTLMDMNFTRLYRPSQIVLLYRSSPYSQWEPVEFRLKDIDYLEVKDLRQGEYVFAVKRY